MDILDRLLNYELPEELIAQEPVEPRDHCRLLVVDRSSGTLSDRRFYELTEFLEPGDVLVLNDTKVLKARLYGRRRTGGRVEILLIRPMQDGRWLSLVRPLRKMRPNEVIELDGGARLLFADRVGDEAVVQFEMSADELSVYLDRWGHVPLPPYIKGSISESDYQTVYARTYGAVAAPTAGLHFTPELLRRLESLGVLVKYVTLHVGLGTFESLRDDWQHQHTLHAESFHVPEETAAAVNAARALGKKVVSVGTTSTRALESATDEKGLVKGAYGDTSLFIKPGYRFKVVDRLITNFHLPKTSLLLLVAAFASPELMLKAYEHAVAQRYRFYSLGDAMLIL